MRQLALSSSMSGLMKKRCCWKKRWKKNWSAIWQRLESKFFHVKERKRMMGYQSSGKIGEDHLGRSAVVYLRQSSEWQVQHNKESQRLQYVLVDRVKSLGWSRLTSPGAGPPVRIEAARRRLRQPLHHWRQRRCAELLPHVMACRKGPYPWSAQMCEKNQRLYRSTTTCWERT